jgi:uncharacterized protein YjbI with pentapeptide repeats
MVRTALVVGINSYSHFRDLKAPAQDAEAIAQQLQQDGEFKVTRLPEALDRTGDGLRPTMGQTLAVTQPQLERALEQLFCPQGKQPPDTALFYFSGHGLPDPKGYDRGYLVTSDTDPHHPRLAISLRWLHWLLSQSPIPNQIVWLDCCHSGGLLIDVQAANPGHDHHRNRCFIASSRDFEKSWQDLNSPYSVLTRALLEGLDPSRLPGRWVDTFALVDYVNQALKGDLQTPTCTNFGDAINLTRTWRMEGVVETETATDTGLCPYKGLEFFDWNDADARYFFGRETLTSQLLDQVRTDNFMALVGASGNGKSSVLRAGLLYQLQQGKRIAGSDQWQILLMRPDAQPMQHLAEAFLPQTGSQLDRAEALGRAEGLLKEGGAGLARLVQAATAPRVVLVIDQFEEVFTRCEDGAEREQFFACLMGGLTAAGEKLCLIIAMRSDFVGKCLERDYSGLAQRVQDGMVSVLPMAPGELRDAICKPATEVGLTVEAALVTEILDDVQGAPGNLPLLQYTLKELWQRRQNNQLVLSVYQALGGINGTLNERATELYESFEQSEQVTTRYIFQKLTQLGEGTEDTRRRLFFENLISEPQHSAEAIKRVIDRLSSKENRLIVLSTIESKNHTTEYKVTVDVAHEALIRHWRLLRSWLEKDRQFLSQQRLLEDSAFVWNSNGKNVAYLLHGKRYLEAERIYHKSEQKQIPLSSIAIDFIQSSACYRRRSRIKLAILLLLITLLPTGVVEYFIREAGVNRNYQLVRSENGDMIRQGIHHLTKGCKARKNYAGFFPLYFDERVFGNCRSLTGVDLAGVDLSGMSLSSVDMTYADLRGTNLENAQLDRAYLMGTDMRGANLDSTSLASANLRRANLSGANLSNSDLHETNMEGTILLGTNFAFSDLTSLHGVEEESLKYSRFCEAKLPDRLLMLHDSRCK